MVIKEDEQTSAQLEEQPTGEQNAVEPNAPYFGRTARVVGPWKSVDASGTPHEKNKRGELGKPLFNWYMNRTASDPPFDRWQ